ncbi:MAG TPA: hypothetical protein VG318_02590 [Actinomycetota bacterium]|nr:hypothetical protein [Actinomycetota bacterium]
MRDRNAWQRDREKKALRPPLDLRERSRLALKVLTVFLAYRWFEVQELSGAAAATAFAAAVGMLSAIELLWLRTTTPRERIFTRTKRGAVTLHAVTLAASIAAVVAAVPRLP